MGFKDSYLYKTAEAFFIDRADDRRINVEAATRKKGTDSLTQRLTYDATTLQKQTLKQWKMAILMATDPEQPSRSPLKKLYQSLELDNHLMATIGNRIDAVRGSSFKLVDKNGRENPEMTQLLKKLWFIEEQGFIHVALMSKYTGTKVIELHRLKQDGHLKEITEVDMAHVIAEKGIIVKQEGDDKGWNYKEGIFKDYYLQVGKDKMLGLFAALAPIVLAKKLGIGSWLDYIEKYGIPPIFVFTDRFDKARLDKLSQAMMNFKSSHYLIGQGNERVEMGTNANAGNSAVFKDLSKLANDEMSKRINGGTGTTDEKSHVGAAKIHADNLKTKIKLDKFFIEVLVNEELIPRLVKLSPVYSGLDSYTFQWDDAESLTLQQFLDYVVSLSAYYEFDTKQLAEKANMPIIAVKQLLNTQEKTKEAVPQKKKSNINTDQTAAPVRKFYAGLIEGLQLEAIDLSTYTKLIERIAKDMHSGNLKPDDLDVELVNQIYADLISSVSNGWGNDWTKFGNDLKRDQTVIAIQQNIFEFSGAKTYAQLKAFNQLLYKDGQLRSFKDFKKDVLKVNKQYNGNYLQAEYQTARQAGHHARNWHQFQKDKDLFPNLQYRTVADDRVREEHAVLHKIIKPVDDPFWDTYYPPNGWRCRCYVVQTTDAPTQDTPADESVQPEFRLNVGKTGTVYSEKHPFLATFGKKQRKKLTEIKSNIIDYTPKNLSDYEQKLSIKVNREIFKLLKKNVIFTQKNLNPKIKSREAYYSPGDNYVKIPINKRRKDSKWGAESVVYHEFGHAIDWQRNLRFSKGIELLRDRYKKLYAKDNHKLYQQINDNLYKTAVKGQQDKDYDTVEKSMAALDTLMSLNPIYGQGHSKAYFRRKGNKEAEFIAHMFENAFIGNDIFKKQMPKLYEEMTSFVKNMQKNVKQE